MARLIRLRRILPVTITAILLTAIGVSFGAGRTGAAAQPKIPAAAMSKITPDVLKTFTLPRSCELQIQQERWVDQIQYYYAPTVTWDWDKASGKIKFRILTRDEKTATVVWQVSAAAFDNSRKNWQAPVGLLATGKIERKAEFTWAEIDFGLFAPHPPNPQPPAQTPSAGSGAGASRERELRARVPRNAVRALPPRALSSPPPPPAVPAGVIVTRAAAGTRNLQLTGPTSFFVRGIALDAKGNVLGYPSQPIEVSWGPQKAGSVHFVAPPQPPPAVHPAVTVTEYVRFHHPEHPYNMLCTQSLLGFQAGKVYDFTPRPASGFDKFIDSWGGLFGFMTQVYNWVAQTYNGIRTTALDGIAAAVGEINPELGKLARAAAEGALNAGMTAMGIPPTLPTTDELVGMGKDYLASTLADQVPGLGADMARGAIDKMASEMKSSYNSGGGNKNVIFVPDPADRYRPAVIWLEVSNPGSEPTTPMDLAVMFSQYTPDIQTVAVILGGAYGGVEYKDGFRPMSIYKSRSMPLPSLAPGAKMRVPFACDETYNEQRDGYQPVQRACWQDGYCNHKLTVAVETTLANPTKGGPANARTQQSVSFEADKDWKP